MNLIRSFCYKVCKFDPFRVGLSDSILNPIPLVAPEAIQKFDPFRINNYAEAELINDPEWGQTCEYCVRRGGAMGTTHGLGMIFLR